jgi:hypothetical protein
MMAEAKAQPGVIQGRAANGRVYSKTKEGRTLRELQEAEANGLDHAPSAPHSLTTLA